MPNITNNRLNTIATAAQITAVKNALTTIQTNLPFLTGLTIEERKSLSGIDVSNKAFTEDAISAAVNNPTLVPTYLSVPNMQNDLTLFTQLDEIIGITKQLTERLDDTQLLAGSEAYASALILYKTFTSAADAGVSGVDSIVEQLGKRFANQGGAAGSGIIATNPNP